MANGNCRQKKKNSMKSEKKKKLLHLSFTAYNLLDKPQAQYRKLKVIRFACLMLRKVDPRSKGADAVNEIQSQSQSLSLSATHALNFNTLIKMFGFKQFYFCFYANAILCSRGRRRKKGKGVVGRRFFMLLWNLLYFSPLIVQKADKKQRHKEQREGVGGRRRGEGVGQGQGLHSLATATQPMQVNQVSVVLGRVSCSG